MGSSGTLVNDAVGGTENTKLWLIMFRINSVAWFSSLLFAKLEY